MERATESTIVEIIGHFQTLFKHKCNKSFSFTNTYKKNNIYTFTPPLNNKALILCT